MKVIYYIRSFFGALLAFLFFTVFSLVALPIVWIVGKFSLMAREKAARAITGAGLRLVCFTVGAKVITIGMENIPDEPCLFVANHRSFFDVMPTYPIMKKYRLGFIGKKEFGKLITFKIWMAWCGSLFLDRKNPREGLRTMNEAVEDLKNGKYIWIYPEGTRNHGKELLPFREGSFKIAEKARCKIVPVAHVHTDDIFELHMPYAKPTTAKLVFGKPIETVGLDRNELKEVYAKVVSEIDRMYKENY